MAGYTGSSGVGGGGGGLTNFTESAAAGYAALSVVGVDTDWVAAPSGTGSFQLQIADGTATGGDVRGANAVDLQTVRTAATQIASGARAFLGGGASNTASANNSGGICGNNNLADGLDAAFLGGQSCNPAATRSGTIGGFANVTLGIESIGIGGRSNATTAQGDRAVLLGGNNNDVSATGGSTLGAAFGEVTADYGVILGGYMGLADHPGTAVFAGSSETPADAQRGKSQGQLVHMDARTTDATPATMGSASVELAIGVDLTAFGISGKLIAWNETDKTLTAWNIDVDVYRDGAGLTFVSGSGAQTIAASDDAGVPALSIGSTGTDINLDITGLAAKGIRWSAALTLARAGS